MNYNGTTNEYLQLEVVTPENCHILNESMESALTLLWFETRDNLLCIDSVEYNFHPNQIICLTEFHRVEINRIGKAKLLRFNRPFYCITDHDSEVGCKGILFFGSSQLPVINIPSAELSKLKTDWNTFLAEMQSKDELQLEMLQMMLKRFLILCTRIYKEQNQISSFDKGNLDIIREFNYLVERHFRSKQTVAEYAQLLNKAPKTLSNLFAKLTDKTPLQFIHNRRMLEARRLLRYADKTVKEVAYELEFEDIQTFSRFFKKHDGISPKYFKELGKIANSKGKPVYQ